MSNSDIDTSFVSETYARMSDDELIRVLTKEAYGLTPAALEIAKEEMKKRNLELTGVERGIAAQKKENYTLEEIDAYCSIIQQLPCPVTGSNDYKLNATVTAQTMSFIFFTNYEKKIVIGSPEALNKANNAALVKSVILGWWGLPWGIIRTIQSISVNLRNKKTNQQETPNDYLRSFVLSRIGEIEAYKNDKEKLSQLISRP